MLNLDLSLMPISDIVNNLYGKAKLVLLKVPINFNKKELEQKNKFGIIHYYTVKKNIIVVIKFQKINN